MDSQHPFRILVVDSSRSLVNYIKSNLEGPFTIKRAGTADTALQMLGLDKFDLLILQLKLPLFSGIELARQLKRVKPNLWVLPLAPFGFEKELAEIQRLGFVGSIECPGEEPEVLNRCRECITAVEWLRRTEYLGKELSHRYGFNQLLSISPPMLEILESLMRIVGSRVPVLITGESGTGKELVARMIHRISTRKSQRFLTVNCAAVPETLLESEFFGHEKGAYTSAVAKMPGKFELADRGSLFLDEIGEMSPGLQAKLLRVLEYGEFERVGGIETLNVDVRMITATNRDIDSMVQEGTFRTDLFFRINVFPIQIPPLRDRSEDIDLLAYYFLRSACSRNNRQVHFITDKAVKVLRYYPWPGNVRELENSIERALLLSDNVRLTEENFPKQLEWIRNNTRHDLEDLENGDKTELASGGIKSLKEIERDAIVNILNLTHGKISLASRLLGIARNTLYKKIEEHNLRIDG